jgi:hypothetical protein
VRLVKRLLPVLALAVLMVGLPLSGLAAGQMIEGRASAFRQVDPQTLPQCAGPAVPAWRRMDGGTMALAANLRPICATTFMEVAQGRPGKTVAWVGNALPVEAVRAALAGTESRP